MEHLVATREASAIQRWTSLSAISKRIRDEWTDADEKKLRAGDPIYNELVQEIERCSAANESGSTSRPLKFPDSTRQH
jgi:hypothetical protein